MEEERGLQCTWLGEVNERNPHVFEKADGYWKRAHKLWYERFTPWVGRSNPRCMPSSSEDLTFAKIISLGKGRKTVNLKTTMILDQIVERGVFVRRVWTHLCTKESRPRT